MISSSMSASGQKRTVEVGPLSARSGHANLGLATGEVYSWRIYELDRGAG
jgi:hypothetical protein